MAYFQKSKDLRSFEDAAILCGKVSSISFGMEPRSSPASTRSAGSIGSEIIGRDGTLSNIDAVKRLSESEKIDLIEHVFSLELPVERHEDALQTIAHVTPLTRTFLEALEEKVIAGQVSTLSRMERSETKPEVPKAIEEAPLDAAEKEAFSKEQMRIKKFVNLVREDFTLRGLLNGKGASLFMSLLLLMDREGRDAELDWLSKTIALNAAATFDFMGYTEETVYEHLKRNIKAIHQKRSRKKMPRDIHGVYAEAIVCANSGRLSIQKQAVLFQLLFDGLTQKASRRGAFAKAKEHLFKQTPIPEELKEIHERAGVRFVAAALKEPDLVRMAKLSPAEWQETPIEGKKRYIESLYRTIGSVYGVTPPTVGFFKCKTIKGGSEETTILGLQAPRLKRLESGKRKVVGKTLLNENRLLADHASMHDLLEVAFHEFSHLVEEVFLRKPKFGHQKATDHEDFAAAMGILKYGRNFYSYSKHNIELYRSNPLEKHTRWVASCMMTYFDVLQAEIREQENPGRTMKEACSFVKDVVGFCSMYKRVEQEGGLNGDTKFDELKELGTVFIKGYSKDASMSLEATEAYGTLLSKAHRAWNTMDRQTYLAMQEVVGSMVRDLWGQINEKHLGRVIRDRQISFRRYQREKSGGQPLRTNTATGLNGERNIAPAP